MKPTINEEKLSHLMTLKKYSLVELNTIIADSPRDMALQLGEKQAFCFTWDCLAFTFAYAFEKCKESIVEAAYEHLGSQGGEVVIRNMQDIDGVDNIKLVLAVYTLGAYKKIVEYFIIENADSLPQTSNKLKLFRYNFTPEELDSLCDNYIELI